MGESHLFSGIPNWDYMSLRPPSPWGWTCQQRRLRDKANHPRLPGAGPAKCFLTPGIFTCSVLTHELRLPHMDLHSNKELTAAPSKSLPSIHQSTNHSTHTCARGNFAEVICDFYFFWADSIRGTYWVAVCISEKTRTTRGSFITSLLIMNQNHLEFTSRTLHVWILAPAPEYCQNGLRVLERVNLSKDL